MIQDFNFYIKTGFLLLVSCLLMSTASCARSGLGAIVKNRECVFPDSQSKLKLTKLSEELKDHIYDEFGYRADTGYEFGEVNIEWPIIGHNYIFIEKKTDNTCDYKFFTFTMAEKVSSRSSYYKVSSVYGSPEQINNDLKILKEFFSPKGENWFNNSSLRELKTKSEIIKFLNDK